MPARLTLARHGLMLARHRLTLARHGLTASVRPRHSTSCSTCFFVRSSVAISLPCASTATFRLMSWNNGRNWLLTAKEYSHFLERDHGWCVVLLRRHSGKVWVPGLHAKLDRVLSTPPLFRLHPGLGAAATGCRPVIGNGAVSYSSLCIGRSGEVSRLAFQWFAPRLGLASCGLY